MRSSRWPNQIIGKDRPLAASRTSNTTVVNGKLASDRVSFAKIEEPLPVPDLLGLQTSSYGWLIGSDEWRENAAPGEKSGLEEIFEEVSPIQNTADTMGLVLSNPHLEGEKASIAERDPSRSRTSAKTCR